MKNIKFLPVLALLFTFSLQSCLKDTCERTTTWNQVTPIYKTQAEINAVEVSTEAVRSLKNPGTIYFYNDFIFINEVREGVHIIDNSDPSNPVNRGFINIEGNGDIAIKDGRLYADSYTTLFTLDVSDIDNITVINRLESALRPLWENPSSDQIYVYNEVEEMTEVVDCETRNAMINRGGTLWFANDFGVAETAAGGGGGGGGGTGGGAGTGGSMARFTLINNNLYTVGQNDMDVFSLTNLDAPVNTNTLNLGWGIETIFPYGDKLFIGSNSGMQIWDAANPNEPVFLSEFRHATACDPVFVKDNYAYVTLRDGSFCQGFNNQLDLIDITDLTNPILEKTFEMDNPHGLSIDGNNLFLCEGDHGLKVFDIEDPTKLDRNRIDHVKNVSARDVIAVPGAENVLLMIGDDGFFQYDYSNPSKLRELSRIVAE